MLSVRTVQDLIDRLTEDCDPASPLRVEVEMLVPSEDDIPFPWQTEATIDDIETYHGGVVLTVRVPEPQVRSDDLLTTEERGTKILRGGLVWAVDKPWESERWADE